jgi:hypothetical protein
MTFENEILNDFKKKVCGKITLKEMGKNRYMIKTPFKFEDGDLLKIILKKDNGSWYLTDEGHTLMHINYEGFEIDTPKRQELFSQAISRNFLENDDGEIRSSVVNNEFGNSLYSFIQGLMKIIDLEYLSQEHIRTLFFEDLKKLLDSITRPKKFEYIYEDVDKNATYSVDCRIELPKIPIHVFGTNTDERCKSIAIACYFLEKHNIKSFSIVIHENEEIISPKVRTQLTDEVWKQYTSLNSAKSELPKIIEQIAIMQS